MQCNQLYAEPPLQSIVCRAPQSLNCMMLTPPPHQLLPPLLFPYLLHRHSRSSFQ
jgi:hypothetical protein